MKGKGIKHAVELGEDSQRQFKENIHNIDSLAAEMAAFANSEGGILYIGVSDDGSIPGLSSKDITRINQMISNCASQHVRSPLTVRTENVAVDNGRIVIILTVPKGLDKPYFDKNGIIWLKNGADKRKVNSKEELRRLFQSVDLFHADELPTKASIDKIDKIRFRDFIRDIYQWEYPENIDELQQLLQNMNLAADNGLLNLAGVLLFAEQPELIKPQFVVKAICYPGNDIHATSYIDTDEYTGSLAKQFEGALGFIKRNISKKQGKGSVNSPGIPEIPQAVFEELLVNALIHRDYLISAPIRLFIFDNRVEIISPGHLPNNLTIEKIRIGNSNIRNPVLTSYVAKGLLPYKGIGSGIRRALDEWGKIDFTDDRQGATFTAVIHRMPQSSLVEVRERPEKFGKKQEKVRGKSEKFGKKQEKVREKLEKSSGKVLELLISKPNMTIPQLAEELHLTTRAIEKQLASLKKKGAITRIGPTKGGYWQVNT